MRRDQRTAPLRFLPDLEVHMLNGRPLFFGTKSRPMQSVRKIPDIPHGTLHCLQDGAAILFDRQSHTVVSLHGLGPRTPRRLENRRASRFIAAIREMPCWSHTETHEGELRKGFLRRPRSSETRQGQGQRMGPDRRTRRLPSQSVWLAGTALSRTHQRHPAKEP